MQQAFKQMVTIQPGGVVRIQSLELTPGRMAEVIVIPEEQLPQPLSLSQFIGSAPGCYPTPDDADAFLRHERDSWEG